MPASQAVEEDLARIQELIASLEALPESTREPARALLEVVLDLHAAGLKRLVEMVRESSEGETLLNRLAADDRVEGLLLLHGLHPNDLNTRVHQVLERLHPHVGVHDLRLEADTVSEAVIRIRVCGEVAGKGAKLNGLEEELKTAILEAAPEVGRVEITGLENMNATFVSVESLRQQAIERA
jgi:hypothetical protein